MWRAAAPVDVPAHRAAATRTVRIQPTQGWRAFDLGELWEFRELFLILALRDVKLRYKQTALGVAWVVLQPLAAALIFALIFGRLIALPSDGVPYALFVYTGLLPWNLFAGALQRAGSSVVNEGRLISKVYFPRIVIPLASAAAVVGDFAVAMVVLFVMMALFAVPLTANLLALPLVVLLALAVAVGVSLWVSALNVYYRDFAHALPFLVQVWLYASPVVYSSSVVPERWLPLFALNPMVGAIDAFRWSVLGTGAFPWTSTLLSVAVGCALLAGGSLVFRRVERGFADAV